MTVHAPQKPLSVHNKLEVEDTPLEGLLLIHPKIFNDVRGLFFESYMDLRYQKYGIATPFVQDNISVSYKGVLRGLHYQLRQEQAKLVSVIRGEVFDVAVDIRLNSPTYGKWYGHWLSGYHHTQMYIPEGFAHGFCVMSKYAIFNYKCSDRYSPENERGIIWNDPELDINWPIKNPILSNKDQQYSGFSSIRKL